MTTHHSNLGTTGHIASEIAGRGSVTASTKWDEVDCRECLLMKPRSMKVHVENCPGEGCECPETPVAGW